MRKNHFLYFLWILLSVGVLSSCDEDKDDGGYAIDSTSENTWGFVSNEYFSEGITVEFADGGFEIKVTDFLGEEFVTSGRFFSRPPFTTELVEESTGLVIATMESFQDVDDTKQLTITPPLGITLENVMSNSVTKTYGLAASTYNLKLGKGAYTSLPASIEMDLIVSPLDQSKQDVTLNWSSVSGATQYLVYAITSPVVGGALVSAFPQVAPLVAPVAKLPSDIKTVTLIKQSPNSEIVYYVQAIDDKGAMGSPVAIVKYVETLANTPSATARIVDGKLDITIATDLTCKEYLIIQKYNGEDSIVARVEPSMSVEEVVLTIEKDIQSNQAFVSGISYEFYVVGVDYFGIQTAYFPLPVIALTAPTSLVDGGYDSNGNRILTWDAVVGATSYNVYLTRSGYIADAIMSVSVPTEEVALNSFSAEIAELTDFNSFIVVPVYGYVDGLGNYIELVEGEASSSLTGVVYLAPVIWTNSFNHNPSTEEVTFLFETTAKATGYNVYCVKEIGGSYDLDNKVLIGATFVDQAGSSDIDTAKVSTSSLSYGTYQFYIQAKTDATVSDITPVSGQARHLPSVKGLKASLNDAEDIISLTFSGVDPNVTYRHGYILTTEGDPVPDPFDGFTDQGTISGADFIANGSKIDYANNFTSGQVVYFYVRVERLGEEGVYSAPAIFRK